MQAITKDELMTLVANAFCLEAISDKPGCTTRYEDLPGKPLDGFIIAGINSSRWVSKVADDNENIFTYFTDALRASNDYKTNKFVNFGLLEIMFPTVIARMQDNSPNTVVDRIIEVMEKAGNQDVTYLLEARTLAWSTAESEYKKKFVPEKYAKLGSPMTFYRKMREQSTPELSDYQWAEQYEKGLPIIRAFLSAYRQAGEWQASTTKVFGQIREESPEIKVGMIADMCAAALFLYLSFQKTPRKD